jgi:hypothetical protein
LMFDIYLMVIWDSGYILQYVFKHENLENQRRFSSNSHSMSSWMDSQWFWGTNGYHNVIPKCADFRHNICW